MITIPETPITEVSFSKWNNTIRLDVDDAGDTGVSGSFHYYIIPLIPITKDDLENRLETIPALWSSESDEFKSKEGVILYTMRLFDEDLPEITTEEEVEIIYKILTKKDLI